MVLFHIFGDAPDKVLQGVAVDGGLGRQLAEDEKLVQVRDALTQSLVGVLHSRQLRHTNQLGAVFDQTLACIFRLHRELLD